MYGPDNPMSYLDREFIFVQIQGTIYSPSYLFFISLLCSFAQARADDRFNCFQVAAEFSTLRESSLVNFLFGVPVEYLDSWHSGVGNDLRKYDHQDLGDPSGLDCSQMDTIN